MPPKAPTARRQRRSALQQYMRNSLLDAHWKPGMTIDEGLQLLQLCAAEMKRRFAIVRASPANPPPLRSCAGTAPMRRLPARPRLG